MAYGTQTVGAAAVLLPSSGGSSARTSILIQNVHATNVLYVGLDSSVTTANGIKVVAGGSLEIGDDHNGTIYVIASGAGTDVRYMEIG